MKIVALVSGGKDSCFNILHCLANGHELVALANLYPPASANSDEIDSFMYQTVGHHALELYDQCLGVPMYRAPIIGQSIIQTLEYDPEGDGDETEDLYNLFNTVLYHHPDIKGVSVGAILSTYQRTRVESVCQRLELISLAYLWQRPQDDLLDEIIESGIDARIIKTAALGLNKSHLGRSLGNVRPDLIQLNQMYGIHLCGEGGEYETLVLDAPMFNKRLMMDIDKSRVVDQPNDHVSYLASIAVKLEDVEGDRDIAENVGQFRMSLIPPLLDERFQSIFDNLDWAECHESSSEKLVFDGIDPFPFKIIRNGSHVSITNISSCSNPSSSLEDEVTEVFDILMEKLTDLYLTARNLTFVSLLVSDMSSFSTINTIYKKYFFTAPNPAARQCIQARLPGKCRIQVSVNAVIAPKESSFDHHNGLHVQGQSYWAPANIGPYSQAIQSIWDSTVTLAGQIGLIPASMELADDEKLQTVIAYQSITRVLEAVDTTGVKFASIVAFTTKQSLVPLISKFWDKVCTTRSLLIAIVDALPRNASIEWTGCGINSSFVSSRANHDSDDDDDDDGTVSNKMVWPPVFEESGVRFGHTTVSTLFGSSVPSIGHDSLTWMTVYVTSNAINQIRGLPCEVVVVNSLYDREREVDIAAVVRYD